MASTIFSDVKKYIGLSPDNTAFDTDLEMHINSAFAFLTRAGCGPETGFRIDPQTTTWDDYTDNAALQSAVQSYIYHKVRLSFDDSTMSSFVLKSHQDQAEEALWTINNFADYWYNSEVT